MNIYSTYFYSIVKHGETAAETETNNLMAITKKKSSSRIMLNACSRMWGKKLFIRVKICRKMGKFE